MRRIIATYMSLMQRILLENMEMLCVFVTLCAIFFGLNIMIIRIITRFDYVHTSLASTAYHTDCVLAIGSVNPQYCWPIFLIQPINAWLSITPDTTMNLHGNGWLVFINRL